jgi:hypothetical protein
MHPYFINEAKYRIKDKNRIINISEKYNKIKTPLIYDDTETLNTSINKIKNSSFSFHLPTNNVVKEVVDIQRENLKDQVNINPFFIELNNIKSQQMSFSKPKHNSSKLNIPIQSFKNNIIKPSSYSEKEKSNDVKLTFNKNKPFQNSFKTNFNILEKDNFPSIPIERNNVLFTNTSHLKSNNLDSQVNKIIINYKKFIQELPKKTIYFVYQYNYRDGEKVTGLGDYIRGIYFILQFKEKYNFNLEFYCNHKIRNYLEYFSNKPFTFNITQNDVPYLTINNWENMTKDKIIDYKYIDKDCEILIDIIKKTDTSKNDLYLYLTNHPDKTKITENHRIFLRKILTPTNYLNNIIDEELLKLNLTKYDFITFNIRTSDDSFTSFVNKETEKMPLNIGYLLYLIKQITEKIHLDILIISNNNNIKKLISNSFKNVSFKFNLNNICHTADDNANNSSIINTLTDFYIMTFSKYIFSFSVYEHGSGFSKWCAETYNIPYICYNIKNIK